MPYHTPMNTISFKIPLRPVSVNHSHKMAMIPKKGGGKRLSRVKTSETTTYQTMFTYFLKQIRAEMDQFWSIYDPEKHAISLDAYFYVNKELFFTKAKSIKNPRIHISRKGLDLDNVLKIAIDTIFEFSDKDDCTVTSINAQKIPTIGDDCMFFTLTLSPFPVMGEFSADQLFSQLLT